MGRRRVKTKKRIRKCNCKIESSGKIKRQKGRGKVGRSVIISVNYQEEEEFLFFYFKNREKKSLNREKKI